MKKTITAEKLRSCIENTSPRSAWKRGVKLYALELVDNLEPDTAYNFSEMQAAMMNGAHTWNQYSEGGCSLIYSGDIAERLCTPSELKKTRNGERNPNSDETWIDVQSRAIFQAFNLCTEALVNA